VRQQKKRGDRRGPVDSPEVSIGSVEDVLFGNDLCSTGFCFPVAERTSLHLSSMNACPHTISETLWVRPLTQRN